ncbi:Sir2 silent information regulator family NAD-dependent deacetylase [Treponema vincentii]|uniref:Sir2 silent information regulator family NAD-dependent deacetylase n=1 Tax=Treponema vincentii TaxID=69710 RepID=A0A6P1Y1U9_9SPIR|nr:Sir2 silent information regulator family NAD-dependent deacetylase [Treponema vincentii]QHX43545.1 Sir2 silent information regulator family NAD-dependent deacetylase [Treponema vincentii]
MREAIEQLKQIISEAETVVIGAGSGLSTSAGFTYSGERFEKYFSDFAVKYGFQDMYSGGFAPFASLEERWAYWSRYIMINRYMDPPKPVYNNILSLVRNKDYFVLTTNVDHCFQKAGFDKERLFYTQGDYGLFQCSEPCHQKTYDNEKQIRAMWEFRDEMKIPSELVPHCPVCGKPMSMNLRADDTFVTDEGWSKAANQYETFLQSRNITSRSSQQEGTGKVLFLELGVGRNTPGIIKYPFWQMTAKNPNAQYVCINFGEAFAPYEIEKRSLCINDDIGGVLQELL